MTIGEIGYDEQSDLEDKYYRRQLALAAASNRLSGSHVRINLDQLGTRNREKILLDACLNAGIPFVVDNTNPAAEDRRVYLEKVGEAGFRRVGYYFSARIGDALARNAGRGRQVPVAAVRGTRNRLERPSLAEGFDELFFVTIDTDGEFQVEGCQHEVR